MGTALRMAKNMIEDKEETPSRAWRPAVVLVSDGEPNDDWEQPLEDFIRSGRSSKCQRFGIPVGKDANRTVIRRFAEDDGHVFDAENAEDIPASFKKVTMSVSKRSRSRNPNEIPGAARGDDGARERPKAPAAPPDEEDPEF